ncbi:hypothetical protein EMPS_08483 [Entomortierella parvispora]|uniref:Ricin B lectin domain-containing protein n=1 Tax=Entomortierella parvispora TaxID=205924 RepID=A0A9P3HG74_9FUNG|nr:hypothetical protein EMPS_08483 [Entomortierella parvispora]
MLDNLRIRSLISAVLAAAHVFVLASGQVVPGVYLVRNVAFPERVLDEKRETHTADGWVSNGGANQLWNFAASQYSKSLMTIQNCETQRYLRSTGSIATTNTTTEGAPRTWLITDDDEGRISIDVVQDFTRGIGLTGGNYGDPVNFAVDTGSLNQKWRLEYKGATCAAA